MTRNRAAPQYLVAVLCPVVFTLMPASASAQLQPPGFGYRAGLAGSVRLQGFTRLGAVKGTLEPGRSPPGPAGPGRRRIDAEIRAQAGLERSVAVEWRAAGPLVVRGSAGHLSTTMQVSARSVRFDGGDPRFFELEELGRLSVWSGSLGVQWRFGRRAPVVRPFVGAGLGVSHWSVEDLAHIPRVEEIVGDTVGIDPVTATLPAAELQAGVDLPLASRFRIRLEVSDHVSRNPLADDDFRLGSNFEAMGRADDWVHTLRGGVGVLLRVF